MVVLDTLEAMVAAEDDATLPGEVVLELVDALETTLAPGKSLVVVFSRLHAPPAPAHLLACCLDEYMGVLGVTGVVGFGLLF